MMDKAQLKKAVKLYWNKASCGTEVTTKEKHSPAYFEEIENFRYKIEPEIFSFAQFSRFHGKKVLEVGVGAGTDFMQWVRSGAQAYGIDLTPEAIENVQRRLAFYHLKAKDIQVADAEHIPYPDNFFDLVFSWGVIHHSPDTLKCLKELVRVTKPGGAIKVMIYNRRSLFALYQYTRYGFLKGKFFRSLKSILFNHQESLGTKAFSFAEVRTMLVTFPVEILVHKATVTSHDLLYYKSWPIRLFAYLAACLGGWHKVGWFMTIELKKDFLQEHL